MMQFLETDGVFPLTSRAFSPWTGHNKYGHDRPANPKVFLVMSRYEVTSM